MKLLAKFGLLLIITPLYGALLTGQTGIVKLCTVGLIVYLMLQGGSNAVKLYDWYVDRKLEREINIELALIGQD